MQTVCPLDIDLEARTLLCIIDRPTLKHLLHTLLNHHQWHHSFSLECVGVCSVMVLA
uniref:Uncharacterized protein n=1 Tax=Arundo donax TaxID=35708 RepID=A0A0A8YMG2_ARUDO